MTPMPYGLGDAEIAVDEEEAWMLLRRAHDAGLRNKAGWRPGEISLVSEPLTANLTR